MPEELAVVEEAAYLIGSEESASSWHLMSFASRRLPSGPMAQPDIVSI